MFLIYKIIIIQSDKKKKTLCLPALSLPTLRAVP